MSNSPKQQTNKQQEIINIKTVFTDDPLKFNVMNGFFYNCNNFYGNFIAFNLYKTLQQTL